MKRRDEMAKARAKLKADREQADRNVILEKEKRLAIKREKLRRETLGLPEFTRKERFVMGVRGIFGRKKANMKTKAKKKIKWAKNYTK